MTMRVRIAQSLRAGFDFTIYIKVRYQGSPALRTGLLRLGSRLFVVHKFVCFIRLVVLVRLADMHEHHAPENEAHHNAKTQ